MTLLEWEEMMLAKPVSASISGEHDEHKRGDSQFILRVRPNDTECCGCERCVIIRIKKRRASRMPRVKCPSCGCLFISIYSVCDMCRGQT